jgi:hypothetical protein
MKSEELKSCMHCGKPTYFIEVCSEGRLCSDECEKAWYKEYSENVGYMDSDISEKEVLEMLGNCCEDETEQCIGCGACLNDV